MTQLPVSCLEEGVDYAAPSENQVCGYCGDESDTVRCKSCESVRLRIYRAVKVDQELKKAWGDMADKSSLLAKAKKYLRRHVIQVVENHAYRNDSYRG